MIASEHAVLQIDLVWIPTRDGARLAATLWGPADADRHKKHEVAEDIAVASGAHPTVFELLPYRRRDGTCERDQPRYTYYAARGYVGLRVDMRGSGDSDGVPSDEYTEQEHCDAEDVIAWAAAQPWSNGCVGMFGKSWGAFNSLQLAARRPAALKAIIAVAGTDDRYGEDVHYLGGCVAGNMLPWGSFMLPINAAPPDPACRPGDWRALWERRVSECPPCVHEWLRHQTRDAYWKHGSVGDEPDAIQVPCLLVAGWADGYTQFALNLAQRGAASGNRYAIVGPWAHVFPDTPSPGPGIDFSNESLAFWDAWLRPDADPRRAASPYAAGTVPRVRSYELAPAPASNAALGTFPKDRPGRWIAMREPGTSPVATLVGTADGRLVSQCDFSAPSGAGLRHVGTDMCCGLGMGRWWGYALDGEGPSDQRCDDALSLGFDAPPLDETMCLFGFPSVAATVACSATRGTLVARLCAVDPTTGASTLLSWGALNLSHAAAPTFDAPADVVPDRFDRVQVQLRPLCCRVEEGHRLRLSLSQGSFPTLWPTPDRATLTFNVSAADGVELALPLRPKDAVDAPAESLFRTTELHRGAPLAVRMLEPASFERDVSVSRSRGRVAVRIDESSGTQELSGNGGTVVTDSATTLHEAFADDPLSARTLCTQDARYWFPCSGDTTEANDIRIMATSEMTCTRDTFRVHTRLQTFSRAAREWCPVNTGEQWQEHPTVQHDETFPRMFT